MSTTPTFQDFWDAYGYRRDRLRAQRAWNRLSAADKKAAVAGIAAYKEDCERRGISLMYGQGYLNNRRWEDDFSDLLADKSKFHKGSADSGTASPDQSPTPAMLEW